MSDDDIKALREALAACKGRLPPFGALEVAASPDRIARLLDEVERLQQSHSALYAEVARAVAAERERFIDALADACIAAEIPDSKYESLLIALRA